ncbi:MAG: TonB-dependent receptor, partial [Polyangiaceae bacterium]
GTDIFLVDARVGLRFGEVELRLDAQNLLNVDWNDGEFVYASNFDRNAIPSLVPQRHFSAGAPQTFLGTLSVYL